MIFSDIARDLFRNRRGNWAIAVAANRRAGKAIDLDQMHAIIVIQRVRGGVERHEKNSDLG